MTDSELKADLIAALNGPTIAYVSKDVDEMKHLDRLRADIRQAMCEPFWLTATVQEPGFPFATVGETISGYCLAKRDSGYWLVFDPSRATYYAFWGQQEDNLGAHGVYGDPVYCWSA